MRKRGPTPDGKTRYYAKLSDLRLSPEQADMVRRRTQPFLEWDGLSTRPLSVLLQEAYLQGFKDAVQCYEEAQS